MYYRKKIVYVPVRRGRSKYGKRRGYRKKRWY